MIEKLGHYKIVSELGRGGMGVVYKAYEESLNRHVAIKVLGEHLAHDESFVKRFVREAKAVAALSHPNVIQIFFIGHEDNKHYFVMEFVEGRSVHDMLEQEGALDPLRAARIVQQAASGLAVAHDQGLVHRDIKPANLLVTKAERVKIADFGLALAPSDGSTRLTATNSLMGTPGYLSPEQCCGEPAGPRSDIYSLGMTFYEMLTGSMPFKGESPLAVLRQILDEEPPKLLTVDPDLDPRIASVVERMVAKEPNDRYPTCHELIADLNPILGVSTAGAATSGLSAAPGVPPIPSPPPAPLSARTSMNVSGVPEEAPTQAVSKPVAPSRQQPGTAPVPPPLPPPPQPARAQAPQPVVSPVVAAGGTTKSGSGGKWLLIGAMALMLIVAVSAAGLYFAAPMLRDAPFLRDTPFFKNASLLEDEDGETKRVDDETATADMDSSSAAISSSNRADAGNEGRFDTTLPTSAASPSNAPGSGAVRNLASAAPSAPEPRGEAVASRETAREAVAPPRRAPIRGQPRVAVIAQGEPMFASAAEEALESQLARHGIDLYDERGILELRDSGGASQIAPSSLLGMVAGRGVDVMVLIDVQPVGQRDLDALGRYAYATTARVRVDAYLVADGDAIGRGWSEQVEYAEPNAASKAEGAMGNVSTAVAESIDAAWQDVRSGAR